ncbi:MAG: hypothetical protein QM778_15670 [Myxococcales bacterium]
MARPLSLCVLAGVVTCVAACDGGSSKGARDVQADATVEDAGDDASAADAAPRDAGPKPPLHHGDDSDAGDDAGADASMPEKPWSPGPMPWEKVPEEQVLEKCRLDPEALAAADTMLAKPWAVFRYGKLCHDYMAEGMEVRNAWSATKTLGALTLGMVAYETRELPKALSDQDRVDRWITGFTYNKDALIAHVLAMIAHNPNLAYGQRQMSYDTVGSVQINTLSDVMNAALAQDAERLGDLDAFAQKFLFDKLGMANSFWIPGNPKKVLGFGWMSDVFDMGKIGQLMLRGGKWGDERLLASDWIYRMSHPSFEDANTGYGYLTWLNATAGWHIGLTELPDGTPVPDLAGLGAINPGPCAPVSLWNAYPHGEAPDCLYGVARSCEQDFDVGVWQAIGLGGQVIQVHRGLDMVVVGMDLTIDQGISLELRNNANPSGKLWDAVRPAVIKGDPKYKGDETAFCAAYGNNAYAPDLVPW